MFEKNGYCYLSVNGKIIKRSRFIMEKKWHRRLDFDEIVHHKNGNKKDDRIQNLQVMTLEEHTSLHFAGIKRVATWSDVQ